MNTALASVEFRSHPMAMLRQHGFTLMELLITLSVAAFMVTVGVPSMSSFSKNAKLKNETMSMMQSLAVARSEAIKRSARVILCRSADPTAAEPACGGSARTWSDGWLLFASRDTNDVYDPAVDELLGVYDGASSVRIKSNDHGDEHIRFNPDGTLAEAGMARFAICDDRLESYGRQIDIPLVGRPFLTPGAPAHPIGDCLESI